MTALVVGRDGDVNEVGGGVSVAESNDGNIDVAGLLDGLGVGAGVGHDDQTGLLERAGDVVGKVTGGETTRNSGGTGVRGKLEDSTLTVGASGDHTDVGRVVNGGDDTSSQDNLLPVMRISLEFLVLPFVALSFEWTWPFPYDSQHTRSCQCSGCEHRRGEASRGKAPCEPGGSWIPGGTEPTGDSQCPGAWG